jgi:hypothetical protein
MIFTVSELAPFGVARRYAERGFISGLLLRFAHRNDGKQSRHWQA